MMKTHGPRFFGKPPRKLLAGQDDQSERNEDPKMLQPVVSAVEARDRVATVWSNPWEG